MAIKFEEKRKTQQYLIFVFLITIFLAFFVLWQGGFFAKKEKPSPETALPTTPKIEIDFNVLKNPLLEKLETFEKIPPLEEGKVGRKNPFIPY